MYGVSFDITDEELSKDYLIPLNKAKIERAGRHCRACFCIILWVQARTSRWSLSPRL